MRLTFGRKMMKVWLIAVVAFLCSPIDGFGQLEVSSLFGDHMVIQRGEGTRVWGTAPAGSEVGVSIQGRHTTGRADEAGVWEVTLPRLEAGGPFQMRVNAGATTLEYTNVLVGDVYLASGQSNMEWRIENGISSPEQVEPLPRLRYAKMKRKVSEVPLDTTSLEWLEATEENVQTYSAIAYFFAKRLIQEENIPIGIVENAVGGSPVEAWISAEMLAQLPAFHNRIEALQAGEVDLARSTAGYAALKEAAEERTRQFREEASHSELPQDQGMEWQPIRFPSSLERTGLYNYDGNIWLKREFYWPHTTEGDGVIHLGRADDDDHTYLNGHYLGSTFGEYELTAYQLPEGVLRTGYNTVLVKLHDRHYNGGLLGPKGKMFVGLQHPTARFRLPLHGEWSYQIPNEEQIASPYYHLPLFEPTVLYNSAIAPIRSLNLKGIIWYQGESNSGRGVQYRTLFQRMILDWRVRFSQGHLPFLFVQLANFKKQSIGTDDDYWAELREAQAMALSLPNTAMVTAIDKGDAGDIHPRDKQPVGERLAMAAQHLIYGKDITYTGPVLSGYEIIADTFFLEFKLSGQELRLDDQPYTGFVVAGSDQQFFPAKAKIAGDNRVKVWSDLVRKPEALRYAWAQNPYLSLFNNAGLPAPPFRTDNWEEKSKYK